MVKRRLKGAYWLRWRINKKVGEFHGKGLREAARTMGGPDQKVENVIRDYWEQTRSVAHLGLATGDAILLASSAEERMSRTWDLERVAFRPDWVGRALQMAEQNAEAAQRFGLIPLTDAVLFTRDNI